VKTTRSHGVATVPFVKVAIPVVVRGLEPVAVVPVYVPKVPGVEVVAASAL
jgi:hypothetical protein